MATIIIGSARKTSTGGTANDTAGDQLQTSSSNDTSGEVSMQNMYTHSKGWYILRLKSVAYANKVASLMKEACNNAHIGYDQNGRLGIITYGVSTTTDTECDCSSLIREIVKESTGTDPGNFTTANEKTMLLATGLFDDIGAYTSQSATPVYNGDILVTKTKGHTVAVVSGNARSVSSSSGSTSNAVSSTGSTSSTSSSSTKTLVKAGQTHANNFAGCGLTVDGVCGTATKKAGIKVLQTGLNLDYSAGLKVDGECGTKTKNALGSHYVKKGETQYMVTVLEILLYLKGYNPNGCESPGVFGTGCYNATLKYQKANGLTADGVARAATFESLIS